MVPNRALPPQVLCSPRAVARVYEGAPSPSGPRAERPRQVLAAPQPPPPGAFLVGRSGHGAIESAVLPLAPSESGTSVRPLRPTDLVALALFQRRAAPGQLAAGTWPDTEPGGVKAATLGLALHASLPRPSSRQAWVARQSGRIVGMVIARPRAGGYAWDVLDLRTPTSDPLVGAELLERVAAHAARCGSRRVFLAIPADGAAQEVARRAAFERYTRSTLLSLSPGFRQERADAFEGRPRLRVDEQPLFQLYMAAVPAPVRAAEALTIEEWRGLHRGSRPWRPSLGGSRQQLVWELGTSLVGWMQITFGQRSQLLEVLIHPRYEDAADRLLRYALLQASPRAPVYLPLREYALSLERAAHQAAFQPVARHDLFVKLLAARVKQPLLARAPSPAQLGGG